MSQEELEGVSVASDGTGSKSFLNFEVILEESMENRADAAHWAPTFGAAARKRRSASRSRSSVMGKYTAVDSALTWPMKVARCKSRDLGSMPSRYQRSNVATAKDRRRS